MSKQSDVIMNEDEITKQRKKMVLKKKETEKILLFGVNEPLKEKDIYFQGDAVPESWKEGNFVTKGRTRLNLY